MASKDPLAKLFGSVGRVKIMRLFIAGGDEPILTEDVMRQTKTIKSTILKELKLLEQIEFLKKASCKIEEVKKLKKGDKVVVKSKACYALNTDFDYLSSLRSLLTQVSAEQCDDLSKRIRKTGRIKAIIIAGSFLQDEHGRVDLLIVGDALKHRVLESAVRATEAELGQGLRYAVFSTNEFEYRINMRDKLICDIFEAPHKKLINRIAL